MNWSDDPEKNPEQPIEKDVAGLPESAYDAEGICSCPFCNGRFKVVPDQDRETPIPESTGDLVCRCCGYTWRKRKSKPKKCPGCQSPNWEKGLPSYKCMICGHEWNSSVPNGPDRCPSCRSVKWREPMVRKEVELKDIPSKEYIIMILCREYDKGCDCTDISKRYNIPLTKVIRILKEEKSLTDAQIRV